MTCVLITGGAGYIGSNTASMLLASGVGVVVVDDLSSGSADAVPDGAIFYRLDVSNKFEFEQVLREHKVDAVLHCAGRIVVSESVERPFYYYDKNAFLTKSVVESMVSCGVRNIVFSSTASIYGDVSNEPVSEGVIGVPVNPYAETKLVSEMIIRAAAVRYGLNYVIFRYFNVAGASLSGDNGIRIKSPTHLVPNVVRAALGQIDMLKVFGSDYPTRDGYCVRDYVHVLDLARAHCLAISGVVKDSSVGEIYNLGSESGYSVGEVIKMAESVLGVSIPHEVVERRPGDPATVLACIDKVKSALGWIPQYGLKDMILTEYRWRKSGHV